ncbi:hypothetical protein [Streptomyces sp. NPDC005231]|uniref:hypothetical protein n=1 Tax=Streptomyces sp. NPDC005231 TaxID=3157026 RepID=UPI0033BCC747
MSTDQEIREPAARQEADLRRHREPEEAFADGEAAMEAERTATGSGGARRPALAYKRALQDGRVPAAGRPPLGRSA